MFGVEYFYPSDVNIDISAVSTIKENAKV